MASETLPPPIPSETNIPPTLTNTPRPPTKTPIPTKTMVPPKDIATFTPTDTLAQEPSDLNEVITSLDGLPIDAFFEESYRHLLLRDPDRLFTNGLADTYEVTNDQFSDQSVAHLQETAQLEIAILDLLQAYDRNNLTSDQQLSYDIYAWVLNDCIRGHEFMFHDFPVNSLTIWGKQNWLVDFMVNFYIFF